MEHEFTSKIMQILRDEFGDYAQEVFDKSLILQYINFKTRSAGSGSKSRSAFANHYALYVLLEDYVNSGYVTSGAYKTTRGQSILICSHVSENCRLEANFKITV